MPRRLPGATLLIALFSFGSELPAAEPNDTWSQATDRGTAREVIDQIDFFTPGPDTTLGLFDENGGLLTFDDDGSFFGNGFASAITGWPVNPDGSIRFAVSGFGDYDFDGVVDGDTSGHAESGDFLALLTIRDTTGRVVESLDLGGELIPGETVVFPTQASPEWIGGSFDLELSNFFGPASDVDFWEFGDLPPGAPFVAEVVGGDFDTLLGQYDDLGVLINLDDDGGTPPLSRLEGIAPASGNLYLAVTAYPDFAFTGVHSASGGYTLRLTVIPEPTGAALLSGALSLAWGSRRRCSR